MDLFDHFSGHEGKKRRSRPEDRPLFVKKGGVDAYENRILGRVGISITKATLAALKKGEVEKQQIFEKVVTALDELLLKMGILKK